jgi:SPP1 gp7 family putative phage head morphogenesis protein
MKELKPITTVDAWALPMTRKLSAIFYALFYRDILGILDDKVVENAKVSPLMAAIKIGKISYAQGQFRGAFSAAISKELRALGASFDKRTKGYRIDALRLTGQIRAAVSTQQTKIQKTLKEISEFLIKIPQRTEQMLMTLDLYADSQKIEGAFDKHFRETVTQEIGVEPKITDKMRKQITKDYTENYKLSIKKFQDDEILKLRGIVEKNVMQGFRPDTLIDDIFARQKISKTRAAFVAKQETRLFLSSLRESKYKTAGLNEYRWRSRNDSKTRPIHRKLNNQIFSWDNPPVIDEKGRLGHPEQDYGCRCKAIPIVRGF